jgi:hypothetical protein
MEPVSASLPKGMLSMLMFNPRRFYHAAAIDAVERHLIVLGDVLGENASRQFWGSRLLESSRRSAQDKAKTVETKKAIPAIAAAIRGALTSPSHRSTNAR